MKIKCKKREIEIDEGMLGAIMFMEALLLKNDYSTAEVFEKWLDGLNEIEVSEESFTKIIMLYGVLKNGIKVNEK